MLVVGAVYFLTLLLGLLAFQNPQSPITFNLIDSYGRTFLPVFINLLLVVAVFFKYPLQFFPMISLLERNVGFGPGSRMEAVTNTHSDNETPPEARPLVTSHREKNNEDETFDVFVGRGRDTLRVVLFRCAIVALTALFALLVGSLDILIEIAGAIFAPLLAFVFPLTAELILVESGHIQRSPLQRLTSTILLLLSITLALLAIIALGFDLLYT